MHRSLKWIVAPLFLLLFFAGRGSADTLTFTMPDIVSGTATWTMQQDAVPDQGSLASGSFAFLLVPVYESSLNRVHTFDLRFFFLSNPTTTNVKMDCDPFGVFFDPSLINNSCDYFNWVQLPGDVRMWKHGPHGSIAFIPGTYGALSIELDRDTPRALATVSTPEPSTLALLLMSLATLFLLAAGVRPSHR